jgi:tetratricopeptide (TPR) repeat protein
MTDLLAGFDDLLEAGDAAAALRAASAACHAEPDLAAPHYAYGQAWLALGDPAKASQAFAAAIQRAPTSPDAWVFYGVARYRQGALTDAIRAMRQALAHDPDHQAARSNLGAFMRLAGNAEGAEAVLRQALENDPNNIGARLNHVADLLHEENAEAALALLEAAGPPLENPEAHRHFLLQIAGILLLLDRADEARKYLDDLPALGPIPASLAPLWHVRQTALALAGRDPAASSAAAARMEASLEEAGPAADPEHQIVARVQLANFWSRRRDYPRAFGFWRDAHTRMQRFQPFSREDHLEYMDAVMQNFAAARFAAGPRAANTDPAPVFIVGMPRSGTTLCEQIIGAHAQAHPAGERSALHDVARAMGNGRGPDAVHRMARRGQAALDRQAAGYLEALHALAPEALRIVDKMPGNTDVLGVAGLLLPGAKIIHCRRDPRDIGLSIFTRRFQGIHPYAHDLADLGWMIAQTERLMDFWRDNLPNPILTIRLADWVEDFDATLARVLDHIGLPFDPGCADFHKSDAPVKTASKHQVREPINARGLGRWKRHAPELAPLIAALEEAGALAGLDTPTIALSPEDEERASVFKQR